MRTPEEILATGIRRSAFANGTEWDAWSAHWCDAPCVHEATCPLLAAVFLHDITPTEWVVDVPGSLAFSYRCTEFQPVMPDE